MSEDKKDVAGEVAKDPVGNPVADWAYPFTAEQMKGWKENAKMFSALKLMISFMFTSL